MSKHNGKGGYNLSEFEMEGLKLQYYRIPCLFVRYHR